MACVCWSTDLVLMIIGNIISAFFFLSPAKKFWGIWKERSTGNRHLYWPYIFTLLNTIGWSYYGYLTNQLAICLVNGLGLVAYLVYVITFMFCGPEAKRFKICATSFLVDLVGPVIAFGIAWIISEWLQISFNQCVGLVCAVLTSIMYVSPIPTAVNAWISNSVESMLLNVLIMSCSNAAIWTAYGFVKGDIFVVVPNVIGVLAGLGQLGIYLIIVRFMMNVQSNPRNEEDNTDYVPLSGSPPE